MVVLRDYQLKAERLRCQWRRQSGPLRPRIPHSGRRSASKTGVLPGPAAELPLRTRPLMSFTPNPPMLRGLGVGTRGEGHGSGTVLARFQQMGPVGVGSRRPEPLLRITAAALGEIGGTACSRRPPRTGLARVDGDVELSGGGSVADGAVRLGMEWLAVGPGRG